MASSASLKLFAIIFSHFLLISVSAKKIPTSPPEMIDAICKTTRDTAYCQKTVAADPTAAASKDLISMARAVIGIGISHAKKTLAFINQTIKTDPTVQKPFEKCADYYKHIVSSLGSAASEQLKESPDTSSYDVMVTMDDTRMTIDELEAAKVGGASVNALVEKTREMNGFIALAVGATNAVEEYYGDE